MQPPAVAPKTVAVVAVATPAVVAVSVPAVVTPVVAAVVLEEIFKRGMQDQYGAAVELREEW